MLHTKSLEHTTSDLMTFGLECPWEIYTGSGKLSGLVIMD